MSEAGPLLGRSDDLGRLALHLAAVHDRGSVVVVVGEPGIGKTELLAAAVERASADGFRVLRTAGVASERHLPFAGLHQLLQPVLGAADSLPGSQRDAILAAVGRLDSDIADQFIVGLAVGNLLRECAGGRPILAVVEDLHWMDRPSLEVLTFVARRVETDPIVVLASTRDPSLGAFVDAAPEVIELAGLEHEASATLIDAAAPSLDEALRTRLLAEACGNPLALTELAPAWARLPPGTLITSWLPVTQRIEAAFASRLDLLPDSTRAVLLVAALNDGPSIAEVIGATSRLTDETASVADIDPAIDERFVHLDEDRLVFRHPLVRSTVRHVAGPADRQAAHAALAATLTDPDRALWHRATSAVAPDESIAVALEVGAARAGRRGAAITAVAALERAAELSPDPTLRGRRLVRAAEFAAEIGRIDVVERILDDAERLDLTPADRARAAWRRQLVGGFLGGDADRVRSIVDTIRSMADAGDVDLAFDGLVGLSVAGWWTTFDDQMRSLVIEAAESLPVPPTDPRLLSVLGMVAPIDRGAVVLERLAAMDLDAIDEPLGLSLLASVAGALGRFELNIALMGRVIPGLRRQGRLSNLSGALAAYGSAAWHVGQWDVTSSVASEAINLADQTGRPANAAVARLYAAAVSAGRGDVDGALEVAGVVEALMRPIGAAPLLGIAAEIRALAALAVGDVDEAHRQVAPLYVQAPLGNSVILHKSGLSLYVDAAIAVGALDELRSVIDQVDELATRSGNDVLRSTVLYARPQLAADDVADEEYARSLAADLDRWPFVHARLLMANGVRLRRRRRSVESRTPLREARELFDALGAAPWADRARAELRAAGEASTERTRNAVIDLTPQELEIARLAASGLTNREIGQRLYLSHRTVGTHLYHVFPKLGITSRSELATVLVRD